MRNDIDFHSHILPGIDDGSASVEQSIAMLRLEAEQGIIHVVATPHFYARHNTLDRFLMKRDRAEVQLREAMTKYDGMPEISVGAEVYFFRGISESDLLPQLTIGGKSCILIEMPGPPWKDEMFRELELIWHRWGITPVIAHVDRYISPFRTYGIPQRLTQLPVMVQANAGFFLNKGTQRMALRMLKQDQIHLLGSDCHNLNDRKPNLGEAMQQIEHRLGPEVLEQIGRCGRALLNG